ncbi:MAG TPA: hypothetical protein VJN70_17250 [Gemmatimonadaceae bacterium]|nr:hypothetical protein [Gemmatimonadaceae bacterium]
MHSTTAQKPPTPDMLCAAWLLDYGRPRSAVVKLGSPVVFVLNETVAQALNDPAPN